MTNQAQSKEINILVSESNALVYQENTPGDILSTFNKAVRGSFFTADKNFELKSDILKSWLWDAKNDEYVFTLKEGLKFHDGTVVTSKDFEFSLLRGFFSPKRSFYNIYLGNIEGIQSIQEGASYKSGLVKGVRVVDDSTIKVKLSQKNPSFLFSLTRPYFALTSQSFYQSDLSTWKKWPVGVGNYKVVDENEYHITLKRVIPANNKVNEIKFYKKRDKNVVYDLGYISSKNDKLNSKYITDSPVSIKTIFFNQYNELSKNVHFRNSMYYLLERKKISDTQEHTAPSYQFLTSNFWMQNDMVDEMNLVKAKEEFKKIPKILTKKTWKIPIYSSSQELSSKGAQLATILQAQMESVGFKMEFIGSTEKFLNKSEALESPFRISGRICDNLDPLLMFGSFRTDSAYKYDNAQNDKEFDKLYEEAAKASGNEDRVKTLRKLSKYALEKRFFIPLLEEKNIYYYNSDTIKSMGNQTVPTIIDFDLVEMK